MRITVGCNRSLIFEEVTPPMETDAKSPKKKSRCNSPFYSTRTVSLEIRHWFLPSIACIVHAIVPDDPERSGSTQSTMRPDCGEYRILPYPPDYRIHSADRPHHIDRIVEHTHYRAYGNSPGLRYQSIMIIGYESRGSPLQCRP